MKIFVLFAFLSLTFTSFLSRAALFIEPSLTHESGTLTITNPTTFAGDQDEKVMGLGVGFRAGLHFYEVLFAAADLRFSKPKYDSEAMGGSADATAHNAGVTLGGQMPLFGLRVWGTSILDGQLNPDAINGADVKYTGFKGYRVGAGIKILLVSLNLEYQEAKYDTGELESFGPFTSGATAGLDGKQKSYIVSVSFPFAN